MSSSLMPSRHLRPRDTSSSLFPSAWARSRTRALQLLLTLVLSHPPSFGSLICWFFSPGFVDLRMSRFSCYTTISFYKLDNSNKAIIFSNVEPPLITHTNTPLVYYINHTFLPVAHKWFIRSFARERIAYLDPANVLASLSPFDMDIFHLHGPNPQPPCSASLYCSLFGY